MIIILYKIIENHSLQFLTEIRMIKLSKDIIKARNGSLMSHKHVVQLHIFAFTNQTRIITLSFDAKPTFLVFKIPSEHFHAHILHFTSNYLLIFYVETSNLSINISDAATQYIYNECAFFSVVSSPVQYQ